MRCGDDVSLMPIGKYHVVLADPRKMAASKYRSFLLLAVLLGLVNVNLAQPKDCVNTPFDLVIASEDSGRLTAGSVEEVNRVYSAVATRLNVGGQHRMAYYTITTTSVVENFDLDDHLTSADAATAFKNVALQDNSAPNAQIAQGLDAIKTELDDNGRPGIARYGLVLDASNAFDTSIETSALANIQDGTRMYVIGVGQATSTNLNKAVSTIVGHPPVDRSTRALLETDFNFLRDGVLEFPLIRLLCPGDLGGLCNAATVCNKAANTRCVLGTCVCNQGLQNTNGVCVTGPVLGEACAIEECSVPDSVCSPVRVCQCMEGFSPIGTTGCKKTSDDGKLDTDEKTFGYIIAALPFLLTSVRRLNPSTLVAIAK
ncbi:uncharacterized protein [Argopecten irradians]|uniref:uncharacterized protein n=1 Tax=Argopecten irradians TaxID=31199 RepID=UPI0037137AEF